MNDAGQASLGWTRDPICIVGSQRSGTTLLGQIIGAHPSAALVDEEDGLYDWTFDRLGLLFEPRRPRPGAWEDLRTILLRSRRKYRPPSCPIDSAGRPGPGVLRLVLKGPNLTYDAAGLAHWFPDARIIQPIRDVRDVVASALALAPERMLENQMRYLRAAKHLHPRLRVMPCFEELMNDRGAVHVRLAVVFALKMSLLETFSDSGLDVLLVRYESLVRAPESHLDAIFRHCGLSTPGDHRAHTRVFRGDGPGGTKRQRPIDRASIGRARRVLSRRQLADIESACGDWLEDHGYLIAEPGEFRQPGPT